MIFKPSHTFFNQIRALWKKTNWNKKIFSAHPYFAVCTEPLIWQTLSKNADKFATITDFLSATAADSMHSGWAPRSGCVISPARHSGQKVKLRFLAVLSPDPQNIPAKLHRRRPNSIRALGCWRCWHRGTDGQTFDQFYKSSLERRLTSKNSRWLLHCALGLKHSTNTTYIATQTCT